MIKDTEIRTIIVNGEEKTAIRLGYKEDELPRHIFQGDKYDSLVIENEEVRPVRYGAIHNEGEERYVYFEKMELFSLERLFTTHRHNALKIIRNIAKGLMSADKSFLNLETGVFPLYRIFIYGNEGAFLVSPDIGDVLSLLRTHDERISEVNALIRRESEDNYRLIAEMGELLYYAATGSLPYISEDVRLYKYQEFAIEDALSLLKDDLDEKTTGFINLILHAKRQEMRDIMGNRSPAKALSWFLSRSEALLWDLKERSDEERSIILESDEFAIFSQKAYTGAKRNTFFRKKGTIITVSLIAALLVAAFLYDYISGLLAPPSSAGLSQEGVVASFYDAQNSLLVEEMMSSVKRGVDIPQEMEVMNLYVTSRMRMAYEFNNPVIDATSWLSAGMPDIPSGCMIYGVTDITFERIDENTILAHSVWYTPYSEEGNVDNDAEETAVASYFTLYKNEVTQEFEFEWNKRGWWNIIRSEITEFREAESYRVSFISEDSPSP